MMIVVEHWKKMRKNLFRHWNELNIPNKFKLIYISFLILVALVAGTSIWALAYIRLDTERAIVSSTEIQRLVLEMDAGIQEVQRLEKDFLYRLPTLVQDRGRVFG